MNDNEKIQKEEDEISLLDLFAVVLRYRKLIIGITLVSVVLAVAGYLIYPYFQYKDALEDVKTQGIMQMEIVQKAQPYVSQGLESFILRPDNIYNTLYNAGMKNFSYNDGTIPFNEKNKATIMYLINLFWIQNIDMRGNIFNEKEINRTFVVKRNGPVVEVMLKDKDSEMIKKFMEQIFILCTQNVEENMRSNVKMMVNNYERLLDLPKKSESVQMMLEKDFDTYVYLKDFLDGKEVVVKLVSDPVYAETPVSLSFYRKNYEKTVLIIIIAGIFIAVMLAFALNAISNIKNDKEAMKKIQEALGHSSDK